MSILLGILGAEIFSGVAVIFIFFAAIAFLPDIVIGILVFLIYALFIGIAITGLCITCGAGTGGGKFGGVVAMIIGIVGFIFLLNRGDIADYARQQKAKQQTAILDNAKTFISIENLCNTEDIEMVEILFTPKIVASPAVQNYRGYNTNVYVNNVNNQRTQNAKWEQAWPSPSSEVPFEIRKIPVAKNDTCFALRLTTKDKTQTVLDEKTFKPYFRHKVYFEPKDINPNEESLIKIVYDGTKLLIENDNVIRNDEPFFAENTIIFYDLEAVAIRINDQLISNSYMKWEKLQKHNSNYKKDYQSLLFNHLDENDMPLNVTMIDLEPGTNFSISYTDYRTIKTGENVRKTYIANKKNLIFVDTKGFAISDTPNFCKFDYVK